jgi:hypothetical protein
MTKSGVFLDRVWYNPALSMEDIKRALAHIGYENVEIEKVDRKGKDGN